MNKELNKKLAEWVGIKPIKDSIFWKATNGDMLQGCPYFTESPDACFKWLVPPVEGKGLTLDYVSFRQASGRYYAEWKIYKEKDQIKCGELLAEDWQTGADLEKITALALCKAIEQLIDGETQ